MTGSKADLRQSELRVALPMVGTAANATADTILPLIDGELAKLYENTNAALQNGGIITFTGTAVQFSEALEIALNSKISGASPQVISLGSTTRSISATNKMIYAVIDRTAGTATVTADASALPAVTSSNQEVFLIAKRVDAADGTKRLYFRNGMGLDAGQSVRLGSSGNGSGSGTLSPTPGYGILVNDPFEATQGSTDDTVNQTLTKATYDAGNKLYQISCDKSRTVAASSTSTNVILSGAPGFTPAAGDVLYINNTTRRVVASGAGTNSLAYSDDDGITWTGLGTSIFSSWSNGVVWTGTRFVAFGSGTNSIAHSTAGSSFTGLGSSIFTTSGNNACWNGSRLVACGIGTNSLAYSDDGGLTWTGLGTSIFSDCKQIAWNGTRFVACGIGTHSLAYSNDGITWVGLGSTIFSTSGLSIAWNGYRFVAGGTGTNTLAYSSDGINWTANGASIFTSACLSVVWGGTKFVANGNGGQNLATSIDGITWVAVTGPASANNSATLSYNGINYVLGVTDATGLYYSPDGLTWTASATQPFSVHGRGSASAPAPYLFPAVNTLPTISANAAAGQWRKITAWNGGTNTATVDVAFSATPATGDRILVSQAVHTQDLVAFGDSTQLTRPGDFYPATDITQIVMDYTDSLTSVDAVGDFNSLARIVGSASNSGLQFGGSTPTGDKFTSSLFQRPLGKEAVAPYILSSNTNQQGLFLTFFANPTNTLVTTTCNLLDYDCNFYADAEVVNGGVLASAYGYSDNSTTPYNMTVSTSGGFTLCDLAWSFNDGADPGGVGSQLTVKVNGQDIPKFVSSSVTPTSVGLSYTLGTDANGLKRRVTFSSDLSVTPVDIKITKQFGVIDATIAQTARFNSVYDFVVGTAAQVTAGVAQYSSLTTALTAASAGSKIFILNGTITENVTIDKEINIEGKGRSSVISGNLIFTTNADYSTFNKMKVTGNVTFNSGAGGIFFNQNFVSSTSVVTDSGTANNKLYVVES